MGVPNLRAIRDWVKELVNNVGESVKINGQQVYLDEQNGKYGINTDPKRGADTFRPFKDDEGGGGGGGLPSPLVFRLNIPSTTFMDNTNPTFNYYLPEIPVENIEKVVLKTLSMSGKRNAATTYNQYIYFYVYAGGSRYKKSLDYPSGSTSTTTVTDSNVEIDLNGNQLDRMQVTLSSSSSNTSYYRTASVNAILEVYLKQ